MFKKPKRNFRKRQDSDVEDEDDAAASGFSGPFVSHSSGSVTDAVRGPVVIRTQIGGGGGGTVPLMDQKPFVPGFHREAATEDLDGLSEFELAQKLKSQSREKKKKKKEMMKETPPSSLLSFDALEDADVEQPFKIKKSKESRRLEREMKKEKRLEKARRKMEEEGREGVKTERDDDDDDGDEGHTFIDADGIHIRVKNFNVPTSVATPSSTLSGRDVKPSALLGGGREPKREDDDEEDHRRSAEDDDDDDEDIDDYGSSSPREDRFGVSRRRAEGPRLQRMLEEGKIPDAALIHAVRKRRQQLAQGSGVEGGADFVPLKNKASGSSSRGGGAGGSRLVSEDQEYDEDMTQPLKFSVDQYAAQRQEIRDNFLAAEHGSDDADSDDPENDEALRRWERDQIKKGFTGAGGSGAASVTGANGASGAASPTPMESLVGTYYGCTSDAVNSAVAAAAAASLVSGSASSSSNGPSGAAGNRYAAAAMAAAAASAAMPDSILDIKKRLRSRLDGFESVARGHRQELDSLEDSLALTEHSIRTHDSDVRRLEKKYTFFQETRCYATDLVDCLDDKLPKIEALEASAHALWRKRAERLQNRYQADVRDAAARFATSNPSKTLDAETKRRLVDRECRRARRRQARAATSASRHEEGLSTDDEEAPSDIQTFRDERLRLHQSAAEIWDDVVDDFHRFDLVLKRFEEWKRLHGDSYQNAFVAFCLPGLLAPFVRMALIGWSPFPVSLDDGGGFEDSEWFQKVLMYNAAGARLADSLSNGRAFSPHLNGEASDDDIDDDGGVNVDKDVDGDEDFKIIPRLVEKVIVPKLAFFVEDVWNPLSSVQTRRLSKLLQRLVDEYPSVHMDSKNVQAMVKAVVARLKRCLNEDVYVPLYSKELLTDKTSEAAAFFDRQLWTCIKLFGHIFQFSQFLGLAQLQDLAFASLLNRYVVIGLSSLPMNAETLNKCRALVDRVPERWIKRITQLAHDSPNADRAAPVPALETFARHVSTACQSLGAEKRDKGETAFREAREIIKQGACILRDVYAYGYAKSLAETFSFKI